MLQEKQLEAACKKLWVAVHGAEYEIRQLVREEQKEGGANQAMLGRLNKHLGLANLRVPVDVEQKESAMLDRRLLIVVLES